MVPATTRQDGMPRLELILLHSANAGGYNAGRLLSATTSRFMASAFVFMASIRHLTAALQQRIESGMSLHFEELEYRPTPIGALSLRRRRELSLGVDVFEIKLGDEYLMSSLFTASEIALARLGLAELSGADLDVVVVVVLALAIPPKRCSSMRRSSLSSLSRRSMRSSTGMKGASCRSGPR